nr:hypothetical protein [uncultured Holophaga sp.]
MNQEWIPSPTPDPTPAAPPPRKSKTLWWVLGGCGVVVLLAIIAIVIIAALVGRKIAAAGKNPAVAAAELAIRANPDLDLVGTDYDKGTITIRDRKSGEVITLDASEAQKGQVRFRNAKGEGLKLSGAEGKVHLQTEKGEATLGAGAVTPAPDWVPSYPGASAEGLMDATVNKVRQRSVVQKTGDSVQTVQDFFEAGLKAQGFSVSSARIGEGGLVTGKDRAHQRAVTVLIRRQDKETTVSVSSREGGD